jgi:hypothetical protein
MRSKATTKAILAGLVFSLLSASVSMGGAGTEGNVRMSRIERADTVTSRANAPRRVEPVKSERTDSWLCLYVSPFFCKDLFPTLKTTPDAPAPVRGRP